MATISVRDDVPGRALPPAAIATLAWAMVAGASLLHLWLHPTDFFLSTDDAMRLAQLRDLIAGQSWFDTVQHRMNAPYGLTMHWPHYVDAGIALLEWMLRPFFGSHAETASLWLWPVLTLLPVLLAVTRIGNCLGGRRAALLSTGLGATCLCVLALFAPGRIDHHNVQLALCLWMAALLLEPERPILFAGAALSATLGMAIGLEVLPYVLLASLIVMAMAVEGRFDAAVRAYGVTFAAAAAIFYALDPSFARVTPACDLYSLFYAPLAVTGGLGVAAITHLPRNWRLRAGGAAVLTAAIPVLAAFINPSCLAGPYAQVPIQLDHIWLSRIEEAQPAWSQAFSEPGKFLAAYVYALAGCAGSFAFWILTRRRSAGTLALLAAAALAVATIEVRGSYFAVLLALPSLAALAAIALDRLEESTVASVLRAGLAMALLFTVSNIPFYEAGTLFHGAQAGSTPLSCTRRAALSTLNSLPKSTIMAFSDQGPGILAYTHHATIAGPYHRDAAGILDTDAVFAGTPAAARRILTARHVGYVVACPSSPDAAFYMHQNPNGLLARLVRGERPAWLSPVSVRSPALRVWRVLR